VHTAEHQTEASPTEPPTEPPAGALDEAFVTEARRLLDRACTGAQRDRGQAAVMTDDLMDRAKRSMRDGSLTAPYFARVLRACALVRNMAQLPELPPDPLVLDLVAHTVRHGLAAHNAAAQALRGTLAISRGLVDEALDAAVDAMATVELLDEHTVERTLAMSDTAALLDQIGLAELSSDLYERTAAEFGRVGMPANQIKVTADQVRTAVLHGMWLERLGQVTAGAERFSHAAAVAERGLRLWQDHGSAVQLEEDYAASFHAALALADPAGEHEQTLRRFTARIALPGQILARLALVRLLATAGRAEEADATLAELRVSCRPLQVGMPMRLALARGVLTIPSREEDTSSVIAYLTQIEDELWVMRSARARALYARLEHERLRRGREPMRKLTARDPVTALPDRTVLDEMLGLIDRWANGSIEDADDTVQPTVLAMVDIDDLGQINESGSFADGDAALRAVAVTVRAAVRPEDLVIRHTADEIVVLIRGRTLDEAAEVMRGVVDTVTKLPRERGHGATVSIGVVAVEQGESGESALVRADDATAEAKARGGNQVTAVSITPARH
jgi:diguanylate cyclase (GGDEF)-like protein